MRQDDSTVPVIQADRIAAAPYMGFAFRRALNGDCDEGTLVEAFARHRLQALESSPADGDGGVIPEGMILVPREPTQAMADAGDAVIPELEDDTTSYARWVWEEMLKALTPTETGEVG